MVNPKWIRVSMLFSWQGGFKIWYNREILWNCKELKASGGHLTFCISQLPAQICIGENVWNKILFQSVFYYLYIYFIIFFITLKTKIEPNKYIKPRSASVWVLWKDTPLCLCICIIKVKWNDDHCGNCTLCYICTAEYFTCSFSSSSKLIFWIPE